MTDEQSATLFLNHTHTPYSNDITGRHNDQRDLNHHTDYIEITEQLPEDIDIVYNRTEHIETETDLYDDIQEEVEEKGGEYRQFDRHAWFEIDGTEAAIINSVEASVEDSNNHYTINGLPIEDDEYSEISEEELYQAARDAAWTAPAHPFVPEFQLPDGQLDRFYEAAEEKDFTAAINYSTGYSPLVNRLAQGRTDPLIGAVETVRGLFGGETDEAEDQDVQTYADEHDIPIVPEYDTHAAIPERLDGAGVLGDVMEDLREGELPVEELLDADVLSYDGPGSEGLSWKRFIRSFPGSAPFSRLLENTGLVPVTEDGFQTVAGRSYDGLADLDPTEINESSYDPGREQ
jgi:hypothetical protein